ncbi:MAG: class II fructose-bisphosphate aldolase [Caulobacterales bacterium]|nr:class II fructose-bisphosphate aldolase [Caulobacterales bacterium]
MPLVSITPVLAQALADNYAVAAFNPVDHNSMRAMVAAAVEVDAPVIIQTSAKTIRYYGHETLATWMRSLAADAPVPVVLHLDHGKDMEMIRQCIDHGWTSVMIDASDKPYTENLRLTRQVNDWANAAGVGVEAEIGEIGGVEEDLVVAESDAGLTDPAEAEDFCAKLELAAFAGAIGTAHGYYKGEPNVRFDLIEEINRRTKVPMALHGGTGLDDATFQRCIDLGCAKINISTALKHVFVDSFVAHKQANPEDYEPLRYVDAQFEALKDLFKAKLTQFRAAGRGGALAKKVA